MIKLKYITTKQVTAEDMFYLTQLEEILAPYEELEFVIEYNPSIIENLTLESDDDIYEKSILLQVKDFYKYDWIHLELDDEEWKKIGIRPTLWGQHRSVYGKAVTYGRWNESSRRKMQDRYEHEYPDIYEHVVGMIHEYAHSKEDSIALVHSFMYGYDMVYTKEEEKRLKPKRFMKQCSIKKLLEALFGKKETVEKPAEEQVEELPTSEQKANIYRYFESYEITGLDKDFVKLLDEARHIAGIPFVINSGYRSEAHNEAVGGVPNSSHTKGLAVDIRAIDGEQAYAIIKACMEVGIQRIGLNRKENFVHVDVDYSKPNPTIYQY